VLFLRVPDYRDIYEHEAERYQALVAAEDYQNEIPRALSRVAQLDGASCLEVGVGTGRLTRLLLDAGASVVGYEQSPAMLAVAQRLLAESLEGRLEERCRLVVADVRAEDLPAKSAGVALAGWVLGHFCEWYSERWQGEIDGVLRRMWRALTDGGTLIVIETLGTGSDAAAPPNAALADYYRFLEQTWGMRREELRTDYRFDSLDAALESIGFFFGPELQGRVRERGWQVVPEWTGLWWRHKRAGDEA
jgi:SAM-dependent methyltransferase